MEVAELRNDQKEGVKIGPLLEILLLSMCGQRGTASKRDANVKVVITI